MRLPPAVDWWQRLTRDRVSPLDIGIGLFLSVYAVLLVTGVFDPRGRPVPAPALAVLTMTLPVIWRRRWPVTMAVVLGGGALLNCLVIGPMVRCGPCLPALMLAAFALGRQPRRRPAWQLVLAMAALLGSAALQSVTDPQLDPGVLVAMVPILFTLLAMGWLVESRGALAATLQEQNAELDRQREQVAALAADADRARIAGDLDRWLEGALESMEHAAAEGRATMPSRPVNAVASFRTVGEEGRATLRRLRQVVGALLESEGSLEPPPTLRQLDRLRSMHGAGGPRILVSGRPRALPAGLELSGFRTLEHLLASFGPAARGRVEVGVAFEPDALELRVRGPEAPAPDREVALAAARARVELHHGTLTSAANGGDRETVARVPLAADA